MKIYIFAPCMLEPYHPIIVKSCMQAFIFRFCTTKFMIFTKTYLETDVGRGPDSPFPGWGPEVALGWNFSGIPNPITQIPGFSGIFGIFFVGWEIPQKSHLWWGQEIWKSDNGDGTRAGTQNKKVGTEDRDGDWKIILYFQVSDGIILQVKF